ncbi:MAG TPA: hypothetical protein VNE82_00095 [Candidatus Binataceae bacterium]|nr:hypothetical protein [Candidatus Binataceae bacterium]
MPVAFASYHSAPALTRALPRGDSILLLAAHLPARRRYTAALAIG